MSEQKPQTSTSRPPKAAGATPRQSHPPSTTTTTVAAADGQPARVAREVPLWLQRKREKAAKEAAKPVDTTRYAVIITNVENDFGKLHNASLPLYCGLPAELEEHGDVEKLLGTNVAEHARSVTKQRGCGYAMRCRTETRSAEISFYGPADANFAPFQLKKLSRQQAKEKRNTAAAAAAKVESSSASPQVEDAKTDALAATEPFTTPTEALVALALKVRDMHYFEDRLPLHVHIPGHAAGDVLFRAHYANFKPQDGKKAVTATAKKEGVEKAESTTTAAAADAIGVKRPREEMEDDDGVDDCEPEEEEGGAQAQAQTEAPKKETSAVQESKPERRETMVKQFPNRQNDFVTAVAVLPVHVPLRVVRRRLHDLPGYMSAWSLDEKRVRVVFRDQEALFKAKELLDQFGLGAGLRVTLLLSDPLSRESENFMRAREAEGAE